jgi:hypothetical protein
MSQAEPPRRLDLRAAQSDQVESSGRLDLRSAQVGEPGAGLRASDRERRATVRALRDQLRDGRLSDVTFVRRLFLALDARRRTDLDRLMADLPPRRPFQQRLAPLYGWLAPFYRRTKDALAGLATPRLTTRRAPAFCELALPPVPGQYLIGRSEDVDLRLDDISVSRRHALISFVDGGWILTDLGSRNGTWINGWRLPGPAPVGAGDLLDVGSCRFLLVDRSAARLSEATTVFSSR